MQLGNRVRVRIPKASLAMAAAHGGNPGTLVNFVLPVAISAGGHCRAIIREIRMWSSSAAKLALGIQFFSSATGVGGSSLDAENYLGEWAFGGSGAPGDGSKAVGDTFFYYYVPDVNISYRDVDATSGNQNTNPEVAPVPGKLHFRLVNWDTTNDKAAAENLVIELTLEPTLGW